MKNVRIRVGDIFEIPLPDKRKAYAHYLLKDKQNGHLIKVFDYFVRNDDEPDLEQIKKANPLFPSVYTSVKSAAKFHDWKVIGNMPVENFKFPGFISTIFYLTGDANIWYLYDGEKDIRLGAGLPDKYKKLEFLVNYSPDLIVKRIMTGENPYEQLILTNKLDRDKF